MPYRLLPLVALLIIVLSIEELKGSVLFQPTEEGPLYAQLEAWLSKLKGFCVRIALLERMGSSLCRFRRGSSQDAAQLFAFLEFLIQTACREEVLEVFDQNYGYYMRYAFPMDDLLPISCRGSNSEGGIALTLLDTLDTLIVMNRSEEIRTAVRLIEQHVRFDVNKLVNVFEVNIRALGGLLSAHVLLKRNPSILPNYDDALLTAALDLGQRLLPAFDRSPTLPTGRINLKTGNPYWANGRMPVDINETCVACVGTLLLEMGMLSRLTGQSIFEDKAKAAIRTIFRIRSQLGLLGSIVEMPVENWKVKVSSIGAGSDSLYEYLLKAYLLFGEEEYLSMFVELYSAVMHHHKTPELLGGYQWLVDVHAMEGYVIGPWVSSLSAFWPGMQALAGQTEEAHYLLCNYTNIWRTFAALPEMFSIDGSRRHPTQTGYPLRPELIESNFYLYSATEDPFYLQLGRMFHKSLLAANTLICGHANIKDVATGELDDGSSSFFLSETLKYLFLLDSNVTSFIDAFIFSTEAHIFPPLPSLNSQEADLGKEIPDACRTLCLDSVKESLDQEMEEISVKFPLVRVSAEDFKLIRHRRCVACVKTSMSHVTHPRPVINRQHHTMHIDWAIPDTRRDEDFTVGGGYFIESEGRISGFEAVSVVRCVLEHDSRTDSLFCRQVEPANTAEVLSGVFSATGTTVFISLYRPRMYTQKAKLVLASDLRWIEVEGKLLHRNRLKPDHTASQSCPAKVLKAITQSDDNESPQKLSSCRKTLVEPPQKLSSCRKTLVFGSVVAVLPLSGCGRIYNIQDLNDTIAVVYDTCRNHDLLKRITDAGARAIILIQSTASLSFPSTFTQDLWQETEKKPAETDSVLDIPILYVPQSIGKRVEKLLEEEVEVQGMMGMTDADSLTQCPHQQAFLNRSVLEDMTCPDIRVELIVPTTTQHHLEYFYPRQDATFIIQKMVDDLSEDDRVMQELLQSEQQRA